MSGRGARAHGRLVCGLGEGLATLGRSSVAGSSKNRPGWRQAFAGAWPMKGQPIRPAWRVFFIKESAEGKASRHPAASAQGAG